MGAGGDDESGDEEDGAIRIMTMRYCSIILGTSVLLLAGQNARAQAWPEQTSPGLEFWRWVDFSPTSIVWVHTHHLKSITKIDLYPNKWQPDTEKWVFYESGDTIIAKRIQYGEVSFVYLYDESGRPLSGQLSNLETDTKKYYDTSGKIIFQKWANIDDGTQYYFDNRGRVICTVTPNLDYCYTMIDSSSYHSNGVLKRMAIYELKNKKAATPCLWSEYVYDTHGNLIISGRADKRKGCGTKLYKGMTSYKYDKVGRPVKRIDSFIDGPTTYQWMPDNRPVSVKAFDGNGKLVAEEQYTYEF